MCGIAGLIDLRFAGQDSAFPPRSGVAVAPAVRAGLIEPVQAMTARLRHRGPDDAGLLVDAEAGIALGHRRLSIIDLSPAGHQPMTAGDDRYAIVYNGELYNTDELAAQLRRPGAEGGGFHGHSDTEVLLRWLVNAIENAGATGSDDLTPFGAIEDALDRVNGMFAFALYDRQRRSLWLARDRFGEKPLHYSIVRRRGGDAFAFASELQALMHAGIDGLDTNIDRDGVAEYLLLQYVHAPRTILRGVRALPPGMFMRVRWGQGGVDAGRLEVDAPARWWQWSPRGFMSDEPNTAGEGEPARGAASGPRARRRLRDLEAELAWLIDRAVRQRMVSDVPLGAMLSGGVDSALVVSAMMRPDPAAAAGDTSAARMVRTFSIGFADSPESEHVAARETAAALGTDHFDEVIAADLLALMPEVVAAMDAPLGDSSCLPTWLLSRMIRRDVTVALSGDGGDELFGGYGRYADTLREARNVPWRARRRLRTGDAGFNPADAYCSPRWWMFMPSTVAGWMGEWPAEVAGLAGAMRASMLDRDRTLLARMRGLDTATYLPGAVLAKVDRMSMAHSLEVRSPLLDPAIARFAERLPDAACVAWPIGGGGGWLGGGPREMKRLLRRVLAERVPEAIVKRPKRGFGLPSGGWSNAAMRALAEDLIATGNPRLADHLDVGRLREWVGGLANPDHFSVFQVWTVLVLELWLQCTGDRRSRSGLRNQGDPMPTSWARIG